MHSGVLLLLFYAALAASKFCKEFAMNRLEFHPLRHCQRLNKTVIAFSQEESVESCADFAKLNRGLAFNFSPHERSKENLFKVKNENETEILEKFFNCEVLECPEYRNFSSMVNDTRFDHYSLFALNPRELRKNLAIQTEKFFSPAFENATCVPSVGMFILYAERRNYSTAYETCAKLGGNLAHIASERRNTALKKLLKFSQNSTIGEQVAYVGLNETTRNQFRTSMNEPLSCFNFRAWSPGHPPRVRKPGCVAIAPDGSWRVMNCKQKAFFFCELLTSGPNPFVNNFDERCSIRQPNNRLKPTS